MGSFISLPSGVPVVPPAPAIDFGYDLPWGQEPQHAEYWAQYDKYMANGYQDTCSDDNHSKYQLEAALDYEIQGNDNLGKTIVELKLAKAESEQVRLKFLVDMHEMRKQQAELKDSNNKELP